ncbi:protein NRT1/ PTR FAMILY 8.2 [Physcomitrium patens]|uniref:NPF family transporter n=1 Tax=Physcomitrium patens TaxID=3218 RepID=A9SSF9_PHYPA|nr:protein NRT1/ PTR FAMILY 8.2-like [Physcomitrium patens]XP_024377726.1 protein NRT1/ PTR FAMILY 8.2-like [Physcomitrium patens]|eukprot:XP_024377725.1 protein NRT1/ PTR FAMILY 8.2-like [Physcomitrella patens]
MASSDAELAILKDLSIVAYDPKTDHSREHVKDDIVDDITVADGAVDVRGRPSIKSRTGNWKACWPIFGCEVCERVAFYAISSNLVIYLTTVLHEDISVSARNVNNWSGTTFMTPLIGAFIADAYLGRYLTLGTFLCGYFLALTFVTMSVTLPALKPPECNGLTADLTKFCRPATKLQRGFFYFALYLMAMGAGGIKSCVTAFAGDQFDITDPVEAKRKMSFPNWWFVSISFGTMLSVSLLVYVQDTIGWTWGYGIPTGIAGLATLIFFIGTPLYRTHHIRGGSPFTRVAQVLVSAARNWRVSVPTNPELLCELDDKEALTQAPGKLLRHTPGLVFLDKAATVPVMTHERVYRFEELMKPDPWRLCTVTQVEEVKLLVRMLPIWVTNLMFSAVFAQVGTLFLNQGTTLNRQMGPNFQIPAASMPLFVTLTICVFLPLYDKFFVPAVRRITGDKRGLTMLQRIGVGQVISTISITVAAFVEMKRLRLAHSLGKDIVGPLPMTIFWLLPQYMLTGICEVFISVGQMEFFLDQAPASMRSLGNALYLSTVAVGSFLSSLLVSIVTNITYDSNGGWIGNNLNESHMDYFYWLLTGLSLLNLFFYVLFAKWYTYKDSNKTDVSRRSSESPSSDSSGALQSGHCLTVPNGVAPLGYKELK